MNIIQVCPYDLSIPGGVQAHIANLSNQLVKRNHNVLVIAPAIKREKVVQSFDCEVIHITDSKRVGIWGTSIDISFLNGKEKTDFKKILNRFKPDVVHFHTIWNPFMPFQLLNLLPRQVKKVSTFHDTPPDFGPGKVIGGNFMKVGARYFLSRLNEAISVSNSQAKAMGFDSKSFPDHFRVIPNGIDTSVAQNLKKPESSNDVFKIIFIGRLERRKGVFDLLEVYKQLCDHINAQNIALHIVGNGPLKNEIDNYISTHAIQNIHFYTNADDQQKNELLVQSDLMVAPALYGESFGIVLLEGMALGIKVVGYGNAGYLNIGREYEVKNFPAPGDKQALFKIIKEMIEDPASSDYLVNKGLEIAKDHDWAHITDKIESIY